MHADSKNFSSTGVLASLAIKKIKNRTYYFNVIKNCC